MEPIDWLFLMGAGTEVAGDHITVENTWRILLVVLIP
jgi:hypothetical protein